MGMLFQSSALLTDKSVFGNVAFPIHEHTDLSATMIRRLVLMKLEMVGLRGARDLNPSELSGGMMRRVALARAIALDPELIMYDEPLTGLDPISKGIIAKLIRELNDALGTTSIVVTHNVGEACSIADYMFLIGEGVLVAHGTPEEMLASREPMVHQFMSGLPDGPVAYHYPVVANLGAWVIASVQRLGRAGLFFFRLLAGSMRSLRRPRVLIGQVYQVGVLTLVIIVVAVQGYYTLVDFGAESSLGLVVALTLTRELGPVLTALLFAGRAGSAVTAEIGLMKATEQLGAMEMMAVDPIERVVAPRFLAGLLSVPILTVIFIAVGILGSHVVGVGTLGIDGGEYWSSMRSGVDVVADILNGIIKSIVFGVVIIWIAVFEG